MFAKWAFIFVNIAFLNATMNSSPIIYILIFLIDATLMQRCCLKFRLVTSCNNYLCLGLALPFVASGIFWQYTWLLMLSCECTSVYRLNLIMHNYYSYALLTTFWCIYCTSTNIKRIIVLNGEHQMSFNANAAKKRRF